MSFARVAGGTRHNASTSRGNIFLFIRLKRLDGFVDWPLASQIPPRPRSEANATWHCSFFSHRQVHASVKLPALPSVGAQDSSPVVREPTGDEMRFSKEWQGKRYKKMRAFGAFFGGGFY